jgi:hypothetical protein
MHSGVRMYFVQRGIDGARKDRCCRFDTGGAVFFSLQLAYGETGLGKFARKIGGKWAADVKLWYMQYGKIKGTELANTEYMFHLGRSPVHTRA